MSDTTEQGQNSHQQPSVQSQAYYLLRQMLLDYSDNDFFLSVYYLLLLDTQLQTSQRSLQSVADLLHIVNLNQNLHFVISTALYPQHLLITQEYRTISSPSTLFGKVVGTRGWIIACHAHHLVSKRFKLLIQLHLTSQLIGLIILLFSIPLQSSSIIKLSNFHRLFFTHISVR